MMTIIQNKINNSTFSVNTFLRKGSKCLWASVGVLFASYLYFVGAITFSVINQQTLSQETKHLTSTMGMQEVTYLSSQKELTQQFALDQGMVASPKVTFATPQRAFAWNVGQ